LPVVRSWWKVAHFAGHYPLEVKSPEQIRLRLFLRAKEACLGGHQLGEHFTELPQFDQTGVGVIAKIAFGQSTETHELHIMLGEECEVRRWNWYFGHHRNHLSARTDNREEPGGRAFRAGIAHAALPNRSVTFLAAINLAKLV
jgi:hypothetical protein